jgi:RNA polymerase sigma-70 factor (ECF subfamily)
MQWYFRLEHISGSDNGKQPLSSFISKDDDMEVPTVADPQNQPPGSDTMSSAAAVRDELHLVAPRDETEEEREILPAVDVSQFEAIFIKFQTPICNYLYRLVGNREQAYDLAQDVFVKAYRALASGTTIQAGALSSWLYRIASNTATDALRRRRLIAWLPLSLFNEDRGVGAGIPTGEASDEVFAGSSAFFTHGHGYDGARFEQHVAEREVVQRVLEKLPAKYATCLLLYEYEGFSCAEIANMLDVSASAVKMRLMRAREKFIALYQQEVTGP